MRAWEASLVNEMLTQMESFSGIFIASTNLMDELEPASLRRFNLKVKFDFLKTHQAWDLFHRHCAELKFGRISKGIKVAVARLSQLTPGDFAVIVGQMGFRNIKSPGDFLAALEAECALKPGKNLQIGFASTNPID